MWEGRTTTKDSFNKSMVSPPKGAPVYAHNKHHNIALQCICHCFIIALPFQVETKTPYQTYVSNSLVCLDSIPFNVLHSVEAQDSSSAFSYKTKCSFSLCFVVDWICMSPQTHVEAQSPLEEVFADTVFGRLNLDEVIKVEFNCGINVLVRRKKARSSLSLWHVSIQKEGSHPQTRKRTTIRSQICQPLDLALRSTVSGTVRPAPVWLVG